MSKLSPGSLLAVENSLSPLPENILTAPAFCRTLKSPKVERPCRSLCQRPRAGANLGVFFISAICAPLWAAVHIGGTTSSIREDWRPLDGRGALFRLFLCPVTQSQTVEVYHV